MNRGAAAVSAAATGNAEEHFRASSSHIRDWTGLPCIATAVALALLRTPAAQAGAPRVTDDVDVIEGRSRVRLKPGPGAHTARAIKGASVCNFTGSLELSPGVRSVNPDGEPAWTRFVLQG